jgi:L-rhamnose mutarotase
VTTIKRTGFVLKVKQGMIEEYRRHHREVWPEMLEALSRHGWRNYSLFMREDGMLFGFFEAEEGLRASLEGMAGEEVNRRWQEMMAPFFEIPPGASPDQMMVELEEVFHVD